MDREPPSRRSKPGSRQFPETLCKTIHSYGENVMSTMSSVEFSSAVATFTE